MSTPTPGDPLAGTGAWEWEWLSTTGPGGYFPEGIYIAHSANLWLRGTSENSNGGASRQPHAFRAAMTD